MDIKEAQEERQSEAQEEEEEEQKPENDPIIKAEQAMHFPASTYSRKSGLEQYVC